MRVTPGLAEALRRPAVETTVEIVFTDGSVTSAIVVIPDAAATLALKAWARTVRTEDRDAEDLWRCLEIARVEGVAAETLENDATLGQIVPILQSELGADGDALAVPNRGVSDEEAARRRTRIRALLAEVIGVTT